MNVVYILGILVISARSGRSSARSRSWSISWPASPVRSQCLSFYEDLHWVDPSTLELFGLVVERARDLPVLVVLTCRPEFSPPWAGQAHVTALTMNRLGRRQGASLVNGLTGGKSLPAEVLDQIVARTDGVPLFVEELTKTVPESGLLTDLGDHYELAGPLPPLAIPATLHNSLMARRDRLAPAKEVAQIAACIGRELDFRLLVAIEEKPEAELRRGLEQLCESELLYCRGTSPDARYRFKHALVRDAAYESLLRTHRSSIHARVVKAIEDAVVPAAAEETAVHAAAAGLWAKALHYFGVAGKAALDRAANTEGLALTAEAIAAGEHLAGDTQAQVAMIDLHMARPAYLAMGDTANLEEPLQKSSFRDPGQCLPGGLAGKGWGRWCS